MLLIFTVHLIRSQPNISVRCIFIIRARPFIHSASLRCQGIRVTCRLPTFSMPGLLQRVPSVRYGSIAGHEGAFGVLHGQFGDGNCFLWFRGRSKLAAAACSFVGDLAAQ